MADGKLVTQRVEMADRKEKRLPVQLHQIETGLSQHTAYPLRGKKMHVIRRATDPSLQSQRQWLRLALKRWLGTRVWGIVSPMIARWRGSSGRQNEPPAEQQVIPTVNCSSACS